MNVKAVMPDGSEVLQLSMQGQVAILMINRPDKRNAMSLAMWQAVPQILDQLASSAGIRTLILTGSGGNFSAGADISEFGKVRATMEQATAYEQAVDACCDAIMNFPKPTIAVVEGFCMGGGCHLAMSCDFRYAGESAVFAIPAARISIVYGVSGTVKLLALVGLSEAKKILYSGAQFDASYALSIGFVQSKSTDPLVAAIEYATTLSFNAPLSIQGAKKILNAIAMGTATLDASAAEQWIDAAISSDDYREGRTAFVEKRKPKFTGR